MSQRISHEVLQDSVLDLSYSYGLHMSVASGKVHLLADDTNLLLVCKSLKKIRSSKKHDLALLIQWSRSNKISSNC